MFSNKYTILAVIPARKRRELWRKGKGLVIFYPIHFILFEFFIMHMCLYITSVNSLKNKSWLFKKMSKLDSPVCKYNCISQFCHLLSQFVFSESIYIIQTES